MTKQIGNSELIDTWGATGDVVEPDASKKDTGWQEGERPPHEHMNWIHNVLGQKINHVLKNGVVTWSSATAYEVGAAVQHNGSVWIAKAANANSTPADANGDWERFLDLDELDARFEPRLQHNDTATTDPGPNDDSSAGYSVRSAWINTNTGEVFRCIDATVGAAVWVKTTLTLDELGSAATKDIGTSPGDVPEVGTPSATEAQAGLVELATDSEAQTGNDDAKAITPANLHAAVLGLNQAWQDVTSQRSKTVVYTNSTGKPIALSVTPDLSNVEELDIYVDAVLVATTDPNDTPRQGCSAFVIVPDGSTYEVTGPGDVLRWAELR